MVIIDHLHIHTHLQHQRRRLIYLTIDLVIHIIVTHLLKEAHRHIHGELVLFIYHDKQILHIIIYGETN